MKNLLLSSLLTTSKIDPIAIVHKPIVIGAIETSIIMVDSTYEAAQDFIFDYNKFQKSKSDPVEKLSLITSMSGLVIGTPIIKDATVLTSEDWNDGDSWDAQKPYSVLLEEKGKISGINYYSFKEKTINTEDGFEVILTDLRTTVHSIPKNHALIINDDGKKLDDKKIDLSKNNLLPSIMPDITKWSFDNTRDGQEGNKSEITKSAKAYNENVLQNIKNWESSFCNQFKKYALGGKMNSISYTIPNDIVYSLYITQNTQQTVEETIAAETSVKVGTSTIFKNYVNSITDPKYTNDNVSVIVIGTVFGSIGFGFTVFYGNKYYNTKKSIKTTQKK